SQRPTRDALADHRARLGHSLRQRQQRGRSARQLAQEQGRSRLRRAVDPHRARRWLHADGRSSVRPLALRTQLTVFYTAILALLLSALGFTYYQVLARQLDADATADLEEITSGLHGYLR